MDVANEIAVAPGAKDYYEEGPIPHKSVIKLALLDVFANFCVTVGFSIVGSGVK
jgi:hypothetical protein